MNVRHAYVWVFWTDIAARAGAASHEGDPVKTRTTALSVAAPIAALALALSGCSNTTDTATPDETSVAPSAGQSDSATDADTATETDSPAERAVPTECASLDLAFGATLDGTALGACVATALSSYGSGRMHLTTESDGVIEFVYDPEYDFRGTIATDTGEMTLVFVDGEMWMDSGAGFIKGDLESGDVDEQMVGVTAELYRAYSDVRETAKLIQSQPTWNVSGAKESVDVNGESVEAYRITSAGAFTWNEMPVAEFVLWYGEDWVPVGTEATMSVAGMSSTQSQRFFDLGDDIVIEPVD